MVQAAAVDTRVALEHAHEPPVCVVELACLAQSGRDELGMGDGLGVGEPAGAEVREHLLCALEHALAVADERLVGCWMAKVLVERLGEMSFDGGYREVFFGGEVVVDGAHPHAAFLGQPPYRQGGHPVVLGDGDGCGEQVLFAGDASGHEAPSLALRLIISQGAGPQAG